MGKDEYAAAGGGLKLKGAKNAGVDKKRKKKSKPKSDDAESDTKQHRDGDVDRGDARETVKQDANDETHRAEKTEAEKRHDEMRRRRLDDRLKREGVKTHKERVEELNKYLSTLSEHHDMPKIGPG